ncbi:MAG: cell envelope integrity protein TolA [Polyangiales bacterium]
MRRRYREPVAIAFALALFASLSVHLPVYDILGGLADRIRLQEEEARKNEQLEPVEVDFEVPGDSASTRPKKKAERKRAKRKRERIAQAQPVQAEPQAQSQQKPTPPPPQTSPQAVQQHSATPDEAPDNPQFIAEENNRVEEQTVARVRNMVRDDELPSPGRQQKASDTLEEQGNSNEQEIAEAREKEGSDARKVTEDEARRKRPDKAIEADPTQAERVSRVAPSGKQSPTAGDRAAEAADETITITDPAGTFSIRRPSNSSQGGGQRAKGRGPGGKMAWSKFEAAVGSKKLEADRRAYLAERKSSQRGISREKTWNEFRAAIENYVPGVKPGATTALNAAASPFAAYIAAVHRRIHQEFADRFLRSLPIGGSPYQDPTLMTKLEVVLNRDGSVHRVGVVRSSGLLPFDFGAFNSVLRGQPYPSPPSSILSGDGRVYFHWGFYRNQRQCGTFNAEPYILASPRGGKGRRDGLTDAPDWDTVVPADATPTWRTREEESNEDDEPKRPPEKSPPAQPREPKEEAPEVPPAPPGAGLG